MPRQKKVAALVVSALVTASLLAFDASMPSREGPKAPRAEVLKHSDEPQEVQIGAALGAVQEPLSVAPKLGEVELIFAAKPTLVRVDGIPIRPVAGRLLLSEGPHVVELWSGPPDLPVVMPVQVVAGQALKVSLPSSGRPHP